jgi:ELWxxDGT repeat protein
VATISPPNVYGWFQIDLAAMGSALYFTARDAVAGMELWRTDGTAAGTARVKDITPGSNGSDPRELTVVGANLHRRQRALAE